MSAFEQAWSLLKGQYMHPSVMGHFARGQMVREADGPLATEYAFDDHGDPANRPQRFSGTEEDRRFNRQEKIARDLGFETAAEMREESFRPRVREQASSIPQELVDAMIAEMKNPQLEGEEGDNYLSQRDDNRMTNLLAARQTNPSETQIEQLARDVRPANNPRVDVSRGI